MAVKANSLQVHDIRVSETQEISTGGNIVPVKRVTFYVGDHGPFMLTYGAGAGTPEQINSDINGKVRELRLVLGYDHSSAAQG